MRTGSALRTRRRLGRFRYGPGVCKVDWALSGPVPWEAPACRKAGTVHVGGTLEEVATSESEVAAGRHAERPFCLVAQPGVVDATRAPAGRQTLWAYCHVPSGSTVDMTERIEAQIERFAPGFRDLILARATKTAATGRGGKPQLRRRRHHRRHGHPAPDPLPADPALGQLQDLGARPVPLLRLDAPRRRRPRHVRLLGREDCAQGPGQNADKLIEGGASLPRRAPVITLRTRHRSHPWAAGAPTFYRYGP